MNINCKNRKRDGMRKIISGLPMTLYLLKVLMRVLRNQIPPWSKESIRSHKSTQMNQVFIEENLQMVTTR